MKSHRCSLISLRPNEPLGDELVYRRFHKTRRYSFLTPMTLSGQSLLLCTARPQE
jgi:hypothetical protein